MHPWYPVIAGACLCSLLLRNVYEVRKHANRVDTRNPVIFTGVAAAMGVFLVSWPVMSPLDPVRLAFPALLKGLGLGLVALAMILMLGGLWQLRGVENIEHLVTTGLYSRLRHPMYTGFILWILGWGIGSGAVVSLALGLVAALNILYWQHLEELALDSRYGAAFQAYRQATWF